MKTKNYLTSKISLVCLSLILLSTILTLLPLVSLLPPSLIHAEEDPYEFTEPQLYDETAENGIADPEAARKLFDALAPELSLEKLDENYETLTLVATFTNTTPYPMQGYSFAGTVLSNNQEIFGEFSQYILMPGETQRIGILWNLYVDETEFVLDSPDDFELEAMIGNFFDSSGHVSSVYYDALNDEVADIESYPSIPLSAEVLMDLDEIEVEYVTTDEGWQAYVVHNKTQKPIVAFDMFYQDADDYILNLRYYETILPGDKSPNLFMSYEGPFPDPENLEPMSLEVSFFLEGRETSVRYDYGPAMFRSTEPELIRTGTWSPEESEDEEGQSAGEEAGIEQPEITIPETFDFPENYIAVENELSDEQAIVPLLRSLKPEFSIRVNEYDADRKSTFVNYTNTTPYAIEFINFSGRTLSSNKELWFYFQDYVLLPGEPHTFAVREDSGEYATGMESDDDFELSQVAVTFLDGPEHMTHLIYDLKLDRLVSVQGHDYYAWVDDAPLNVDDFEFEIIDKEIVTDSYVIRNNSDQTVSFVEMLVKTDKDTLLQLQAYSEIQPGETSEEYFLFDSGVDFDFDDLEMMALKVVFSDEEREIPIVYDYKLDMYQIQIDEE